MDINTQIKNGEKINLSERLRYERENNVTDGLYHLVQIKFAYNSNKIEGSKLTENQTRFLYETKTLFTEKNDIIPTDDITETTNHFILFNEMLYSIGDDLSPQLIKGFHKTLKSGTTDIQKGYAIGDWKTEPNTIGTIETTPPRLVEREVDELLNNYKLIKNKRFEDIVKLHHDFEEIHPFQDGNGRVGRFIAFRECLVNDITPFVIDEQHRLFYYNGLSRFNEEPGFLIETCKSAQDQFITWENYFAEKSDFLEVEAATSDKTVTISDSEATELLSGGNPDELINNNVKSNFEETTVLTNNPARGF